MDLVLPESNEVFQKKKGRKREREIIILSEVSQTKKDKYHMVSLICGTLKKIQVNLLTKQKQTHRHRKQTYGCQRGKGQGVIN